MTIIKNLKDWREHKALSQRELAELASVSPATINRIEAGIIKPIPKTRRKLAKALDIDPSNISW